VSVPAVVIKGKGILAQERPVSCDGSASHSGGLVRHLLNIGASTVSRAIVGAGSSLTALAFIAREALTLSAVAVAKATA